MAIQFANWSISNIGNFTGDKSQQSRVQSIVNMNMKVAGGIGAYVVGGIWGAIAYVGMQTFNFGLNEYSNSVNIKKQNYEINQLRKISGLDVLTNGGRI